MKTVDKGRVFFTALLLAIAVVFAYLATGYGPKARLIPLAVAIAAILLGLPLLVNELIPIRIIAGAAKRSAPGKGESGQAVEFAKILLWMAGFLLLIFLVGFYGGIILFTLAYLKIQARVGSAKALCISAAFGLSIYLIFYKGMQLDLFKGILMGEILPPI